MKKHFSVDHGGGGCEHIYIYIYAYIQGAHWNPTHIWTDTSHLCRDASLPVVVRSPVVSVGSRPANAGRAHE